MTPDERDLRLFHVNWIDAVNAGDLPRLLELLSDDAVLFSPGSRPSGASGSPRRSPPRMGNGASAA